VHVDFCKQSLHVKYTPNHTINGELGRVPMYNVCILKIAKGIMSKLKIKFWTCQKCGKMKDYNYKITTKSAQLLPIYRI
jgi:hypothetical protein